MQSLLLSASILIMCIAPFSPAVAGNGSIGRNGNPCQYQTLQQAIAAAQPGDTIFIASGTYNQLLGPINKSLTFVPSLPAPPNFSGCETEDTSATSSTVVIDGNGGSHSSTGGLGHISNGATVRFRHMWLRDAQATHGGVLAVSQGSRLFLDDANVSDGVASGNGGNIYVVAESARGGVNPSELFLINDASVYRGHADQDGGAIALVDSEMTVTDGNIGVSSNNGFSTAGRLGGGVFANRSFISMSSDQARIIWNEAGLYGGGLLAMSSNVIINGAVVAHNSAVSSGGGLYLADSTLSVNSGLIEDNENLTHGNQEGGGGVYLSGVSTGQFNASVIRNNRAKTGGGGIKAVMQSTVILQDDSEVSGNIAETRGGGIDTEHALIVDGSRVIDNSAGETGGGIECTDCAGIDLLNNSTLTGNLAGSGGGLHVQTQASDLPVTIQDSLMASNHAIDAALGAGGAVWMEGGTLTVENSTLEDNTATFRGGAIAAVNEGTHPLGPMTINDGLLQSNSTIQFGALDGGGAIYVYNIPSLHFNVAHFIGNTSANMGGAMLALHALDLHINDSTFNVNSGGLGGALRLYNIGRGTLHNNQFNQNSGSVGGALNLIYSNLTINSATFSNNHATSGGALAATSSDLQLLNTQMNSNSAAFEGGALLLQSTNARIDSLFGVNGADHCNAQGMPFDLYCTRFTNNTSAGLGGAIHIKNNLANQTHSVHINAVHLSGNTSSDAGAVLFLEGGNDSTVTLQNALIENNGQITDSAAMLEMNGNNTFIMKHLTVADNHNAPLLTDDANATLELHNSIFYMNRLGPFVHPLANFTANCNNSQNVQTGSQNMGGQLGNPMFTSTARGPYRLQSNSPSRDACITGTAHDLDGFSRPGTGGLYDQGAFEMDGAGIEDIIFQHGF